MAAGNHPGRMALMAALGTVGDFVDAARILLQDRVAPYRYETAELVLALNLAVLEARRVRPDLFLKTFLALPEFDALSLSEEVDIDAQYRPAFLYYVIGHVQLRDEEDTQDARAGALLNKFTSQLLTIAA